MISFLSRIATLWRNLTRRRQVERELTDEVSSYVELATQAKMKDGLTESEARREALVEFGGIEQVKEQVREVRLGHFLETRLQDLRFGLRTLRKSPVFSLSVALVLALGIGSTALMFTIVNSVLFQGPPYPEADRLFMLWQQFPQENHVTFSAHEFNAWKKQTEVFETFSGYMGNGFTLTGIGEPAFVFGHLVTPSLFQTLRTSAALGRVFLDSEGEVGKDHVVILSHAVWRDKFGLRSDVLGKPVVLNGEPYTIVGVMSETFDFPQTDVKLWVPLTLDGPFLQQHPNAHFLRVIGRLKPGVTPQRLQAEVDLLGKRVDPPDDETIRRYFAVSLKEFTTGQLRNPLLVLLCAVGFLLTIACANVANLMLARANARQGEMAIRAAMGASRQRLIAQLLMEAAVLASIGGILGLAIAVWGLDLLKVFGAENIPELAHSHINRTALGFVFLISAISGLLFGLGPAFTASRTSFQAALKGTARSTTGGADRTRHLLVFAEVALASVLLIGCALMMRSFVALTHVDPGFRAENVVTADAGLMKEHYPDAAAIMRFYRTALEKVRALPGAQAVGVVTHLPFGGNDWGNSFEIEGRPAPAGTDYSAQMRPASPGYFSALGIPLKEGHDFSESESEAAPGVAIVNELLAKRFWPNESPLGKKIRFHKNWLSIVAVSGNIKHSRLDATSDGEIYIPYAQLPADVVTFLGRDLTFVVRSANPASTASDLRGTIRALDPQIVVKVATMQSLINESIAQPRFRTWLIGVFSIFALTLACLGIYGVIAYLVTQRYKEIGIRIALGATRQNILQLILAKTLKLTAAGILAGLITAFFLSKFLSTILFGITVHDPMTFVAVPACLIAIALLAGYLPARRATRVDPVTSLRYE
ncbi:MAG TPA: ABC transporter permease [Chthoniobacterales bacterium]